MNFWRWTAYAVLLSVSLAGCSKLGSVQDSSSVAGTPVYGYQDKLWSFQPTSTGTGAYSISTLPSWATFDSTTGTVSGYPATYENSFEFTITQQQTTGSQSFGPYRLQIIGNPLKEYQWALNNTGQSAFALTRGTAGEDIHMTNTVKAGLFGSGVTLAVSDTGAVLNHEALSANVIAGVSRNYLNNFASTNSWIGDPTPDTSAADNAHGTAVSSLAVETGWNGVGGRGVAPLATFGAFLFIQAQDQLAANGYLTQALNDQFEGSFDIFNYSWGDSQCVLTQYVASQPSLFAMMASTTSTGRSNLGSVFVMAGGNSYTGDFSQCIPGDSGGDYFGNAEFSELQTTPYVMNVAALNANGVSSSYSSPGANLWISSPGGEFGLNVAQPGAPEASEPALIAADFEGCGLGIKSFDAPASAFDAGGSLNGNCRYTSTMNGTSGATPIASGAVALILEANPNLSWRDVRYVLASTADKIDPTVNPATHPLTSLNLTGHTYEQGWITNAAGFHFMNYYGFGRVNVDNAVALAKTYTSTWGALQNSNWVDTSGTLNAAIPDGSATGLTETLTTTSTLNIEAVQLRISISHCIGDMGIELTSPSGTKSIIMNINSELRDDAVSGQTFLSNAFYGETATGTWTLKVIDGHATCTANLTNWQLNFFGH